MIPRETIDRIYAAAKIEDVVGDYMTLRRRGANLWGCCPFHDEKTPSFSVSPSKGIYKCFGCGKAGNAVNFIMETEQCSYTDALRTLAKKYHIEIQEKEMTDEEREKENERESLFKVNEWANRWFQQQLWETEEGQNIGYAYFMQRGIREDLIKKFQLGYSPNKNTLLYAAKKAGFQEEFLIKTGLCGVSQYDDQKEGEQKQRYYDRFRDRVIFPLFTISGKVVAFAGRILKKKENVGKYINSPESIIFSKQNQLYGLYQAKQAISKQQICYLVEGQMDVISMHMAGVENVVSSGGTSLTINQIRLLHRLTNNVVILYDGDNAGIHAALRGIDMMLEEGLNIKVVLLPEGEDPDSMAHKMNAADFQEFLQDNQQDFIYFKTNLLLSDADNDPIRRSQLIKDIVLSISLISDLITRQVYIKECSALLDIKEEVLIREVKKIRYNRYNKKNEKQDSSNSADEEITPEQATSESLKTSSASPQDININVTVGDKTTTTSIKTSGKTFDRLDANIRNLLQILVKYGNYPFFDTTVGEYIISELEADQIVFENPLYEKLINEYKEHSAEPDFVAENFFKFHQNSYISSLAISLISSEYDLSRIWGRKNISENIKTELQMPTDAERLDSLVPILIFELKLELIKKQQTDNALALQHAQENNEDVMPFILRAQELKNIEIMLLHAKQQL